MSFVHDFNEANPPKIRRATMAQVPIQQNTVNTVFSLFVDVGCSSSGPTVWGLVLRNSDGETVLSACKREDFSVDPLMAEAMGVQWALQLALDQGINSVSIHSDAANMVNCINRKSSFAAINLIAEDCRNLMNCLTSVCVVFVSRTQNYVAHNLASLW
jgi:ribonuclease HI